jgi:hypothetical protein
MTEMKAHTTHPSAAPIHFFDNGVLTNTPFVHDDWSRIEEDMTQIRWEELLLLLPNEQISLVAGFVWQ